MKLNKLFIITIFLMSFIFSNSTVYGYITPDFTLNAKATAVYNLDTGVFVYTDNSEQQLAPASLTKVMTALVILKNETDLDNKVQITSEMLAGLVEANASVMGLKVGEIISIRDLLYGLLLPSGADAARALAIYNSGSIDAFVNEMNRTADKLGATSTQFENPSGLDHPNQVTTAHDMVKIMEKALEYDEFKKIISTSTHTTEATNKHSKGITCRSTDKLKETNNIYYSPFVIGGKTGYTGKAGRCYASYGMSKNGESYIIVSLNAPFEGYSVTSKAFQDAQKLYSWLDENFSLVTVKLANEKAAEFSIKHSFQRSFETVYENDVQVLSDGVMDLNALTYVPWNLEIYSAPIQKDQFVGYMSLYDGDTFVGFHELKSPEKVKYSKIVVFLENTQIFLKNNWLYLIIAISACFVLYVILDYKKKKKIEQNKKKEYVKNRLRELEKQKQRS